MEGLTAEQAAQAAQWGPDIGPPGPVSYIMHLLQTQGEEAAIAAIGDDSNVSGTPAGNQPTSTQSSNTVSTSSTVSFSLETSASTPSTTQESSSSTSTTISTSQGSSASDPASSTTSIWPQFSLSIPTTSSTSTSVSSSATGVLSYEPIDVSFSFEPTSSFSTYSSTSTSSSRTTPTNIGSQATETASSDLISMPNSRKQAIVGGLAGAIGALVLIGILLCFCLRRRHRRRDDDEVEEDGLKSAKRAMTLATKPSTVRLWNSLGRDETARSTPEISRPNRTPSPVDGSLIRVSTEHWTRPFQRKEGMRESLEPAPLRVVNANSTSSRSSSRQQDRPQGFVRKQRSALQAFLQDGARSESRNAIKCGPISYPKPQPMASDPVYSSKAEVDSVAETLSVGSLPSDTSGPMVVQQPPEDPFYASVTMLSTMEEVAPPMEPTNTTELTRTISHFGRNANPFRTQIVPSVALPDRVFSPTTGEFRASDVGDLKAGRLTMGSNYSRRDTAGTAVPVPVRSSDQFDLIVSPDQMPPASGILAKAAEYEEREKEKRERQQREQTPADGSSPNWKVYEGT